MSEIIWLLDVDGVLNGSRAGWRSPPRSGHATAGGIEYRIRWSVHLVRRINALHSTGTVQIRWATTWIGDTGQIEELLGLPHFPEAYQLDGRHVHDEMKRLAALEVVASGARLIWTDDQAFLDFDDGLRMCDDGHLLIAPNPSRGLRPEDMDSIEKFVSNGGYWWETT